MSKDLITYTSRAMQLEVARYTQQRVMEECEEALREGRPTKPQEESKRPPSSEPKQPSPWRLGRAITVFLFVTLLLASGAGSATGAFMAICEIFVCLWVALEIKRRQEYQYAKKEYENELAQYQQDCDKALADFSAKLARYYDETERYDKKAELIRQKHEETLERLEDALQRWYSKDIIFPKYRNLVAVTTIYEYLTSGRCYELEGPDGAYNLYEMELRQNVIIGQLSRIVDRLDQIRHNQYTLYKEIIKLNNRVDSLRYTMNGVNESAEMAAYFAGVTSLIRM